MTSEDARRQILSQQGLISPFREPLDAVRAMVAVQTQYAFSLPVAVAARTRKPPKQWDEKALRHGGVLIKSWSLRHTLHTHTREDHSLILSVLGERFGVRFGKWFRASGLDQEAVEAKIVEALADRPLSRKELHDRVIELKGLEWAGWGLDVKGLAFRQQLCIVGGGANQCFALMEPLEAKSTRADLLRRYLAAFGPATKLDFRHWTGALATLSDGAFDELSEEIEEVQIEGSSVPRYQLVSRETFAEDKKPGMKLLAKFDPLILAHRDKTLFLPAEHHSKVFRKAAQVEAVVLDRGVAVATWRLGRGAKTTVVTVEPFTKLSNRQLAQIEKEAVVMMKRLHLPPPQITLAS